MKAALIGAGMVAKTHVMACKDSRKVSLKGVCARSSTGQFAKEWGLHPYLSVQEVAADPEIDFAIVITPPDARMEIVKTLVDAGKPILLEKPIERSLAAAQEIVALCDGRVTLGLVFQHRAREASRALAKRLLELGELQVVEITVPWWRDQSYYDEPGRGTYARDGGGVLISQAIHTLDLALSLAGPVSFVQAMARRSMAHDMEAEDFVSAGLEFANGAVGSLHASTASFPGAPETITLHCANGTAVLGRGVLELYWRNGRQEKAGQGALTGGGSDPMAFTHAWHQGVIDDFADALQGNRPPMVTGAEALKVHALIEALTRSSAEGQRAKVKHV